MSFDDVWDRIKEETTLRTFGDLAEFIGIQQSGVSKRKKADIFPPEWAVIFSERNNFSMDWLLFGTEPKYREGGKTYYNQEHEKTKTSMLFNTSENPSEYKPPKIKQPKEDVNIQDLLNMTAKILVSETIYRPALAANIKAFNRAIEMELNNQELQVTVSKMEERLSSVEHILAQYNRLSRENIELKAKLDSTATREESTG